MRAQPNFINISHTNTNAFPNNTNNKANSEK